jgi:hypothetical protein
MINKGRLFLIWKVDEIRVVKIQGYVLVLAVLSGQVPLP